MMVKPPIQPVIASVGSSAIARKSDGTILDFIGDAVADALKNAGLRIEDVNGLVISSSAPNLSALHDDGVDEISLMNAVKTLGLSRLKLSLDTQVMSGSMMAAAVNAVATGICDTVLVFRGMYHDTSRRYSGVDSAEAGGALQFTLPYGLGPGGGRFALWLRRYMHLHGVSRADLYPIVRAARNHAALNELAYWRGAQLSLDEYLSGRWIAEPLSIYDCDIPVCGAGAMIVMREEVARALGRPFCYVNGWANQDNFQELLAASGLAHGDLDVAQIYDGFSCFVLYWLEKFGFSGAGEAARFFQDGRAELGGLLPINTFGGSLGEGRLHGMGHLREAALQAMGCAGARQVSRTGHGMVVVGVPENAWAFLLGRERLRVH